MKLREVLASAVIDGVEPSSVVPVVAGLAILPDSLQGEAHEPSAPSFGKALIERAERTC